MEKMYNQHKKLIYLLAHQWSKRLNIDTEESIGELNLLFCEVIEKFDPEKGKFSTFFVTCANHHFLLKIKKADALNEIRNKEGILLEYQDVLFQQNEVSQEKRYIYLEKFTKNKNNVIKEILKILCTYRLPKTGVRAWLRDRLKNDGFKYQEIWDGFSLLNKIY